MDGVCLSCLLCCRWLCGLAGEWCWREAAVSTVSGSGCMWPPHGWRCWVRLLNMKDWPPLTIPYPASCGAHSRPTIAQLDCSEGPCATSRFHDGRDSSHVSTATLHRPLNGTDGLARSHAAAAVTLGHRQTYDGHPPLHGTRTLLDEHSRRVLDARRTAGHHAACGHSLLTLTEDQSLSTFAQLAQTMVGAATDKAGHEINQRNEEQINSDSCAPLCPVVCRSAYHPQRETVCTEPMRRSITRLSPR